jgi:hypothetical protein
MSANDDLKSPAELVAIIRAAKLCGDRALELAAKRELLRRFGMRVTFAISPMRGAAAKGVPHA